MKEELWKPVLGYEGFYEVSNLGRVRSLNRPTKNRNKLAKGRILKGKISSNGYPTVHLSLNGIANWIHIHRLVALAFIPNPDNLPMINHLNEIKTDNRVENLEWCTALHNNNWGTRTIRSSLSKINHPKRSMPVIQLSLDGSFVAEYPSIREAERLTKIDFSSIRCCAHHYISTAGGYKWEFKN